MTLNDDLAAAERCLDELCRTVGRLERQLDGGLDVRRVRTDTDHLRESVALLRAAAAAPPPPQPARARARPRHPVRQLALDRLGRRRTRRPGPARPLTL